MDGTRLNNRNRPSETLRKPAVMSNRMIIKSRSPGFALTTALSCGLTAVALLIQGAWEWYSLAVFSVLMWVWHVRGVFNSPLLTVDQTTVSRYREAEDEAVFRLSDLKIVRGNFTTGLAFFVAAFAGMAFLIIGSSAECEKALSQSLSPTQRLLMVMSGVWFAGTALSIAHLDFPRRKLILGVSSEHPEVMFIANRSQRHQLDGLVQAFKLEEVKQRVGLGDYGCIEKRSASRLSKIREDEPCQ